MATVISFTARPRRLLHVMLLLLAAAVGVGAYTLVPLGRTGTLPENLTTYATGTLVLVALLAGVTLWRAPYVDPVILPIAVTLNGLGIAVIATVDSAITQYTSRSTHYADRQMLWTVIGVLLACAVMVFLRDHRVLRRYIWISAAAGAALLLMPLLPVIGHSVNGSRIWISIAGYSFQPAELAKIFFALFCAGYLVTRRDTLALAGPKVLGVQLPRWSDFGPILVAWAFALAVLVFQTDLGTSLMFFGMFVAMLYVATDRLSWLIIGAVMFVPPAILAITQLSHVRTRLTCWLEPMARENFDRCGQINNGIFGLANGGLLGTGLGNGRPNVVPYAHSDFIYSSLAEEMGMVGAFAVLMLYMFLVQRALRAAVGISDGFGTLLAAGLGFALALQVFVVIGGITRVIPLTGLTLPFLAAGGSSLVCNWIIAGLLVRLSDAARRPAARTSAAAPAPRTPAEVTS